MFPRNVPGFLNELGRFEKTLDQVFDQLAGRTTGSPAFAPATYPPVNVWQDENSVHVEAELPGVPLEGLTVTVSHQDQLTLEGERKPQTPEKGGWLHRERGFGKFTRVLTLPAPVDADKVQARYENGVLTLVLPKAEAAKPRKIEVKGS